MGDFLALAGQIFLSPLTIGEIEFPFSLLRVIAELLLPILLIIILYRLLILSLTRLLNRTTLDEEIRNKIRRFLRLGFGALALLGITTLVLRLLGAEIAKYSGFLYRVISSPIFESGGTKISLLTLLMLIPVFYIAGRAGHFTRSFTDKHLFTRVGLDESKRFSISNLLRYAIMVLTAVVGLSVIGIDLSALAVMFGVLGIGLGFGLQSVVANMFAGIVIIFSRPIKEGDRVLVGDYEGTVTSIRLISTIINTISYETIIVPNRRLIDDIVYNYSYDDRRIILRNSVQVSYDTDLDQAIEVMRTVGRNNPFALTVPEADVRVRSFDDSGITLLLLTWLADVSDKYSASSWNNLEIWRSFKDEGIEIPFPQRDLHLKDGIEPMVRELRELRKVLAEKS
ncbi:mechanosensitive ion channel domain-containing protein [Marispirochaeta sp.]|jgi:potassium-dependent mechanosensitive channel|uniref:mechanosensitive ion channel family protein n=1 Tax=Marispirochaeta sp. TaxID=2038653 RepID=UPI0029C722AD|nr:mechanosensitive ion channel domain-containing protein [Marispirochaeta sp.]